MAPRDPLVPADVDHRGADQRGAGDVVLPGDREVLLGEAVAAAPREVRVAQQHAATGRGVLRADRGGVGAERRLRVAAERGQQGGAVDVPGGRHLGQAGVGRRRRRRVHDLLGEEAGGGDQVGEVHAVPEVQGGGPGAQVAVAAAARVGDPPRATDRGHPPVDARGIAADHLPRPRAGTVRPVREQLLDHPPVADVAHQGVDLQVGPAHRDLVVVGAGAEPPRPLAPAGDQGVGERADRRPGGGVPAAEAERGEVLRHHVRDAVLGARHLGAVRRRRGRGGRSRCGRERRGGRDRRPRGRGPGESARPL